MTVLPTPTCRLYVNRAHRSVLTAAAMILSGCTGAGTTEFALRAEVTTEAAITIRNVDPEAAYFGGGLVVLGDTNGDGFDDFLVHSRPLDGSRRRGRAYLFAGPIDRDMTTDDAIAVVPHDLDKKLEFHEAVGDVNADGLADVAFRHPAIVNGEPVPHIYVFYGPVSGQLHPDDADLALVAEPGDYASKDSSNAWLVVGDFWGDEAADFLLVGYRSDTYVFDEFSVPHQLVTELDTAWGWVGPLPGGTYTHETADRRLRFTGRSGTRPPLAAAPSHCRPLDGEKDAIVLRSNDIWYDELGHRHSEKTLNAYVWDDDSPVRYLDDWDVQLRSDLLLPYWHTSMCADFDANGTDDLVFATETDVPNGGGIALLELRRGEVTTTEATRIDGVERERLGNSLVALPDITGDGRPELVVAAPSMSADSHIKPEARPHVRLVTGGDPFTLETASILVPATDEWQSFGNGVAAGDLTGDGVADVAVSAAAGDEGRGMVYIFPGTALREPVPRE